MVDRLEDFREEAAGWFLACEPGDIEEQLTIMDKEESLENVDVWCVHEDEIYEVLKEHIFNMQEKLYVVYLRGLEDGRQSDG